MLHLASRLATFPSLHAYSLLCLAWKKLAEQFSKHFPKGPHWPKIWQPFEELVATQLSVCIPPPSLPAPFVVQSWAKGLVPKDTANQK
jgi:hypothetical protein